MLRVLPFEASQRHLRTVSDMANYRKLHSTLPAIVLNALKTRIRAGDVSLLFSVSLHVPSDYLSSAESHTGALGEKGQDVYGDRLRMGRT